MSSNVWFFFFTFKIWFPFLFFPPIFFFYFRIHRNNYCPIKAYTQSKLALNLFTHELQRTCDKAKNCHVNVYSVHPGIVATDHHSNFNISYFPLLMKLFLKVITTVHFIESSLYKFNIEFASFHCRLLKKVHVRLFLQPLKNLLKI